MRGEWRKYSDEQWMRLRSQLMKDPACEVSFGSLHRRASIVAPLGLLAVCLTTTTALDVPWGGGLDLNQEEATMNWMAVSAGTCMFLGSAALGQNLLSNGGLEGALPAACNGFNTLSGGSTTIPGWTVSATNSVDWNWSNSSGACCDWTPQGDRAVDLNGSPAQNGSALRQIIDTVPGQIYRISLLARANGCCSAVGSVKTLQLTTGSVVTQHVLTVDGLADCDPSLWTRIERTWEATATTSAIELRSLVSVNAGGPMIDDISVTEVGPRDLLVPSQYATLAAAVAASRANDRVLVAPGNYSWTPATIGHTLTIEGTGGAMSTRFVGNGAEASPLLECVSGAAGVVTLRNLYIGNGRGVRVINGGLVAERCMFTGNTTALLIEADANFSGATIDRCGFVRNGSPGTAQAGGVGMYSIAPGGIGANLFNCMLLDNEAQEGGGFHVSHSASSATNCLFARNRATLYSGGAIARWWGHVPIPFTDCGFSANSAAWSGTENWNCCVSCGNCNFAPATDTTTDCNGNLIADSAEMLVDASLDANLNGVLDACEPTPCTGDVDLSGSVSGVDLAIVLQNWGAPSVKYPRSDINGDGVVNGSDLALVLSNWGACP